MDEIKENVCQGGKMNGYEFTLNLHAASTRISCPYGGYYQKSAIKNEIEQTIWHWHKDADAETETKPQKKQKHESHRRL